MEIKRLNNKAKWIVFAKKKALKIQSLLVTADPEPEDKTLMDANMCM